MTDLPSSGPHAAAFPSPLIALVFGLLLTLYTFSAALVPIRSDNDVWWHVKSGKVIAESGLPKYDVFNANALQMEWHNHEWQTQLLFWKAWELADDAGFGGFRGVILFNAILTWAAVMLAYLLAWRLSGRWSVAFLLAVLCVAIGRRMYYPRPPTVTNLMLLLEIWLLVSVSAGWIRSRWLFTLVPFFALWTNLHGGWMAGGVVLAAWGLAQGVALLRSHLPELPIQHPATPVRWMVLIPLAVLILASTAANPYGFHLYLLPGRVLGDLDLVRSIGELHSPDFYFVIDFELTVLGFFAAALLTPNFRPGLFPLLIFFFFLHQAIQHVRHLSLFSILMVPLAAPLLGAFATNLEASLRAWRPATVRLVPILVVTIGVYTMGWVLVNPREGGRWSQPLTLASYPGRNLQFLQDTAGYDPARFPTQVADFALLTELHGVVFNENFYAGYLIWRLAPENGTVYTDSRFDIFAGDIKRLEERVVGGALEWEELLRKSDVRWIIAREGTGLRVRLDEQRAEQRWVPIAAWEQSNLSVWVRGDLATEDLLKGAAGARTLTGAFVP